MKSFHHAVGEENLHFLVEQDAAIDDYLTGLLKDMGEASMTASPVVVEPPARKTNPVGLSIVTRGAATRVDLGDEDGSPETPDLWSEERIDTTGPLSLDLPDDAYEDLEDELPSLSPIITVQERLEHVADSVSLTEPAEVPVVGDAVPVITSSVDVSGDEVGSADMLHDSMPLAVTAEPAPPPEAPEHEPVFAEAVTPWRIFTVGAVKVGLPVSEIHAVLSAPIIESIKGAPGHVAGTVLHEGRRCMVLSLSSWFPGAAATAQHVVLLGVDGLWGVQVGAEQLHLPWDEAQTHWRTDDERAGARPWLAGVNRAAGLAFLTVPALRAALKSSR